MRRRTGSTLKPAFLREQFAEGQPAQPPHASRNTKPRSRIAAIQKLYLLYRYAEGYSAARIALELDISESSAKRILRAVRYEPEQFLILGFIMDRGSASRNGYVCRYCGYTNADGPKTALHAREHCGWPNSEMEVAPRRL